MSHYTGARPDEIFVGNTRVKDWPKEYLRGLKTIRLGEQALDIDGKELSPSEYRPVFVGKSEAVEYDKIMMRLTFPLQFR